MVEFYDINSWQILVGRKPPKGSRAQNMFERPETSDLYFFKKSHTNYKAEIWSEIIASKIGQITGFNVLNYDIALRDNELGCLSKNMIDSENGESLYHGVEILNDYFDDFVVSDKPTFSYQDIKKLCVKNEDFKDFLNNFIEIILFDTLIGNTDRHTENWSFILRNKPQFEMELTEKAGCYSYIISIFKMFNKKNWQIGVNKGNFQDSIINLNVKFPIIFAPIYDSGSCLGREIHEDRILNYLQNETQIIRYLNGGKSEIKWEDKNLNFFKLIEFLLKEEEQLIKEYAKKIFDNLTVEKIQGIVENCDNCLTIHNIESHLSDNRKKLIQLLLEKRLEYLKKIIKID